MKKRGMSQIIVLILLILLGISALVFIWSIVGKFTTESSELAEAKTKFYNERMAISDITLNKNDLSSVNISIIKKSGTVVLVGTDIKKVASSTKTDVISTTDLSGSMNCSVSTPLSCIRNSGNCGSCGGVWLGPINEAKEANKNLIDGVLKSSDNKIGLVGFSSKVNAQDFHPLSNDNISLNAKVDSWQPKSSTCICCGINKALDELKENSEDTRLKSIIVMSDGEANINCSRQGPVDPKSDSIKAACDADAAINKLTIYSVGFGSTADEDTLKKIAECGHGKYYFASQLGDLVGVYQNIVKEIETKSYKSVTVIDHLKVIFYTDSSSYEEVIANPPKEVEETKKYEFNLQGKITNIKKIEIYPVIITSSGKEVIGPLVGIKEFN